MTPKSVDTYPEMNERHRVLKQLIGEGLYVVDGGAVAGAILARAYVRATVAAPEFRSDRRGPIVRSFRRNRDARSFRLSSGPNLRAQHH
jgi:hypothetical protein